LWNDFMSGLLRHFFDTVHRVLFLRDFVIHLLKEKRDSMHELIHYQLQCLKKELYT
jgi:hypothetical protein